MDAERKLIMMVDDNLANLKVGKIALTDTYKVLTATSAEKMFELLERYSPEMILLDIEMPDMNGYEAIKLLKERPETADMPVIFLTAKSDGESESEGLSLGAIDYISKPFSPPLLRKRIEVHLLVESQKRELQNFSDNLREMVKEKTRAAIYLQNKIIKTVAELVECRGDITGGHIERTQHCLDILLRTMIEHNIYPEQSAAWDIDTLLQSSQLHDVGKISISDLILQKPGRLTDEEFAAMKKHVEFGVDIIEKIEAGDNDSDFLSYAKIFIAYHHEKWDGSGYPYGLAGEGIPLLGRLMAVADVYDALTSERPYKNAFPHEEAVKIIEEGRGVHFDPALIDLFTDFAAEKFPANRAEPFICAEGDDNDNFSV
ncbi:two-component system response regulator [Synergistales bacterium]|nr:two-component system response regulator [Synergistales bacterium]